MKTPKAAPVSPYFDFLCLEFVYGDLEAGRAWREVTRRQLSQPQHSLLASPLPRLELALYNAYRPSSLSHSITMTRFPP